MTDLQSRPGLGSFAFQTGLWQVAHRKLRHRLESSHDWIEFNGTCRAWELLEGAGNVDDHVLHDPAGTYHAATVRCLAPAADIWSIWWFDGSAPQPGPAVRGRFQDGIGTFLGNDTWKGESIRVRFIWSQISQSHALWEQAFSNDDGSSWESNWTMEFNRAD
jgi:hypothetical protein